MVNYYLNTDTYAKNCENKAKPILKCNGKCQMTKKILEEHKKDEQAPERRLENKIQLVWFKSDFASLSAANNVINNRYTGYLIEQQPVVYLGPIFHPPCFV